ncbi:ethanolamine utilization protein [Rhodobacter sphaeroides]|nr:ethanolamine utilization protein [Cereibacter sphaeroides]
MQGSGEMKVRTYTIEDASFERSPDQDCDVFTANLVDERHGAPVTIGYGRYGPNQSLTEKMAVDDVMIVLEGSLQITSDERTDLVGPGGIVHMPKGEAVTIKAMDEGAVTAYVTYPHWREAR